MMGPQFYRKYNENLMLKRSLILIRAHCSDITCRLMLFIVSYVLGY